MAQELSTKTNLAMDFIETHTFRYPNMDDVVITEQDAWEAIELAKNDVIDKACEWLKQYRQDTPDGTGYVAGIVNDKTIEDFRKAMEE